MPSDTLQRSLTAVAVMDLAGLAVYLRGAVYAREGRVQRADATDNTVGATVRGSPPYPVELRVERDQPQWTCSCAAARTPDEPTA